MEFKVRNVNEALTEMLWYLSATSDRTPSRNGEVMKSPEPITVTYYRPTERVVFSPMRNANPMFHMAEAFWMLAGRNDVAFVADYVKRMKEFSSDGATLHGAYGWRWWFTSIDAGIDQIKLIAKYLTDNPDGRRAVLQMWDAGSDIEKIGWEKDVPCNTHAYFSRHHKSGALDMTVCNRSNDLWWGMCGANAVHFSYLLEYMAAKIGCPVGRYTQFTNNLHVYSDVLPHAKFLLAATDVEAKNKYPRDMGMGRTSVGLSAEPLLSPGETIDQLDDDIITFTTAPLDERHLQVYRTQYFCHTVAPMQGAWWSCKNMLPGVDLAYADKIRSADWRLAMQGWITRKHEKRSKS